MVDIHGFGQNIIRLTRNVLYAHKRDSSTKWYAIKQKIIATKNRFGFCFFYAFYSNRRIMPLSSTRLSGLHYTFITRRTRRRSFAEYWKYFVACFNDVYDVILFGAGPDRFWARSVQKRETYGSFAFFVR